MKAGKIVYLICGLVCGSMATFFFTRAYQVVVHLVPDSSGSNVVPEFELTARSPSTADGEEFESGKMMDLRDAMQSVARRGEINLVISDRVQGTILLATPTDELTPRELLEVIVQSKGLIADEVSGVVFVKTREERAKEPNESAEFEFKNARVADVRSLVQSQLQSGIAPQIDERTNTIFYREDKSNLEKIYRFLTVIDRPLDKLPSQIVVPLQIFEIQPWGDEQLPWTRDERVVKETTPYSGPPLVVDENTSEFEVGVRFGGSSDFANAFVYLQKDGRVTYCRRVPRKDEVQCEEFTIDEESRQSLREAFRDSNVGSLAAAYSGEGREGTLSCDLRCSNGTLSRRINFTGAFPLELRVFVNELARITTEEPRPEGATRKTLTLIEGFEIERRFFPRSSKN